jgi:hypothetical protein
MPHGMFKQCLEEEIASPSFRNEAGPLSSAPRWCDIDVETDMRENDHNCASSRQGRNFEPGTLVVVEGLVKLPTFNGLCAVVQNFDEASGRYNILIVPNSADGVCQQAKVKDTNLRFMLPCQ